MAKKAQKFIAGKAVVRKTVRRDDTLQLTQSYTGDLHASPAVFNRAYAEVLRAMADALEKLDTHWADPELVVWTHEKDKLTAQITLSPLA